MRSALFLLALTIATPASAGGGGTATIEIVSHAPDPSVVLQGIVVSTEITTSNGGTPTGSVDITDGIDGCTAVLPQGFCLYTPGTSGSKTLIATYSGDATYPAGAVSLGVTHEVEPLGATQRVSSGQGILGFDPRISEGASDYAMSLNGRWLAFVSMRGDLVANDSGVHQDVFVVDRQSGFVERVSVDSSEVEAAATSDQPSISADGNFVVFRSAANNLVAGDTDGDTDVFLRDRAAGTTTPVSVDSNEVLGNGASQYGVISGDGSTVVFQSGATNLVVSDVNLATDVFVRDLLSGTTIRVSESSLGAEGNGASGNLPPSISFNGDRIAFDSNASNLIVSDANGPCPDLFVHELTGGTTHVVTVDESGAQYTGCQPLGGYGISGDATKVAYATHASLAAIDTSGFQDIYRTDITNLGGTLSTLLVSLSDSETLGDNYAMVFPSPVFMSGDGNQIAFDSLATNMVLGDTNGVHDVFIRDVSAGSTTKISEEVDSGDLGANGAILSADGQSILYTASSAGGVFGHPDAQLHLRHLGTAELGGILPEFLGTQLNETSGDDFDSEVSLTAEGRFVAFSSTDSHLMSSDGGEYRDIFVRDGESGVLEHISVSIDGGEPGAPAFSPAISVDDGRYVAFVSFASDLVASDTNASLDIFVRDQTLQTTERISLDPSGGESNGHSHTPRISGDGRFVLFRSDASDLVAADNNGEADLFLWDRTLPQASRIRRINLLPGGAEDTTGDLLETYDISRDGRFVVFTSTSDVLAANASNDGSAQDIYLHEIDTGTTTLVSLVANGTEGGLNTEFFKPRLSADGTRLAFVATGNDIVASVTLGLTLQAYVRDLTSGTNLHVSRCNDGSPVVPIASDRAVISGDGRYVAFKSPMQGCALDDDNEPGTRVIVRDLETQTTQRVDRAVDGSDPDVATLNPTHLAFSSDGQFILFASDATDLVTGDTNGQRDLFLATNPVFNLAAIQDVETLADNANNDSLAPASDAAGRFVLFQTDANNLGAGDVDAASDVVRIDTETGDVVRFSVNDDETPITSPAIEPSLSASGDVAVFVAEDSGITALFGEAPAKTKARAKAPGWSVLMRNRITGTTQRMSVPAQPGGAGTLPQLAPGSTAVVYSATITDPGMGTVGQSAVIVVPLTRVGDVLTPGAPRCISCKSVNANGSDSVQNADGDSRAPTVSEDGRYVAWETAAKNLTVGTPAPCPTATTEIVLRDLLSGLLQRVSTPPIPAVQCTSGSSRKPKIDWKGRRVVFESDQPLKPGGGDGNGVSDVYLQDLDAPGLQRVSEAAGGVDGTGPSTEPTISGDGEMVAYVSAADNLDPVEADTNGNIDAHVGRIAGGPAAVRRLSRTRSGGQADSDSHRPAFNYNGTRLAFDSDASNLAPGAEAGQQNVFQRANPLNADLIFGAGFE